MTAPDALLLISGHCPLCPAVLAGLGDLIKRGVIARLEVVNIEHHPETAHALGVRSVPWVRLGPYVLTGARSAGELELWARRAETAAGMADALHDLLKEGGVAQVLELVAQEPARLAALLPILANPEASLNVRLGAGVALEEYAGAPALIDLVPDLCRLAAHADARVRADACHTLGLSAAPAARPCLEACLQDPVRDVREIAADSLALLQ